MAKDSIGKKLEDQEPQCSVNYRFDAKSCDNYFPNLLKTAESRLLKISENEDCSNCESVVKLDSLSADEQHEIRSDMKDWEAYMFCKEYDYRLRETLKCDLPPVRSCKLVPERFTHEVRNLQMKSGFSLPVSTKLTSDRLFNATNIGIRSIGSQEDYTEEINEVEQKLKQKLALYEKVLGNTAFKAQRYEKACEHYSNCILHYRCKEGYNNRAQANMKMMNFVSAIPDLNEVLKMDLHNEKALYRRALCRYKMGMYHEALRDAETVVMFHSKSTSGQQLLKDIKSSMSELKGKQYRVRENCGSHPSFLIDVSQLPVYSENGNSYLLEVDRTGCAKNCVCGFCTEEDRRSRVKSNSLRIKERHRWKPLTPELLREMQIPLSRPEEVSKDLSNKSDLATNETKTVANSTQVNKTSVNDLKIKFCRIDKSSTCAESANKIESLISDISLENKISEKNVGISSKHEMLKLRKQYENGGRLSREALYNIIRSLCNDFNLEKEWNLISQYLEVIANLDSFKTVSFIMDDRLRNDFEKLLDTAISLNLKNASVLKSLYFVQ